MVTLILLLCQASHTGICEIRTYKIYNTQAYCEKMGHIEAAKVSSGFPDGYFIKEWTCANGR